MTRDIRKESEELILKCAEIDSFPDELTCLRDNKSVSRTSPIRNLDPYLSEDGFIHVGGRLDKSSFPAGYKNPIIMPSKHHISQLIVKHYHNSVLHQGRHFTEGAIRSAGFWIVGVSKLVKSIISACVKCRKMRAPLATQKMANLPQDRIDPGPPFSNVGVDAFGPYEVVTRKTRGGSAQSKRWGIIFTCSVTRAIHIEIVDSMCSSAFINALRRFTAIRGKVKIFRSDRGSNFVGALDDLGIESFRVEDDTLQNFLMSNGSEWIFNPPHSPHFGGSWERLIGIVKRILNSVLTNQSNLTHDVLSTLFAEASAIVNSRPLRTISSDPQDPLVLSPAMLLTHKPTDYELADNLGSFNSKDMLKSEWKRVQGLADAFCCRWKRDYLHNLQTRRKWTTEEHTVKEGDVVLLKDPNCERGRWPLALVIKTFPSDDGKTCKVQLKTAKQGKSALYTRPITELVPLVSCE